MKLEQTALEVLEFGDSSDDTFYCLVDRRMCPDGLDVERMRLTDPRNFDQQFRDLGCLVMLTGVELEELIQRGEVQKETLHEDLFLVCKREGLLT
ncbi:MAG: hypothetical protein WD315_08100 [Balneolaceae bacterium]